MGDHRRDSRARSHLGFAASGSDAAEPDQPWFPSRRKTMMIGAARITVGLTVVCRLWPMLALPSLAFAGSASDMLTLAISSAEAVVDERYRTRPQIVVRLDDAGRRGFGDFTARHVTQCAVFLVDGRAASVPSRILTPITGGYAVFYPVAADRAAQIAQLLSRHAATLAVEVAPCDVSAPTPPDDDRPSRAGNGAESRSRGGDDGRLTRNDSNRRPIQQP
ncbi:hypothetical protein [Methylobacterium aquaticum]|nr:hypothetical protein [Methylobacterium aquaticum]